MKTPSKSFRISTSAPARLTLENGGTLPCVIKNLSAAGAQVELSAAEAVSGRFRIEAEELSISTDADIMWQQGPHMGIRFLTRQTAASARSADGRVAPAHRPIGITAITAARPDAFK